MTQPLGIDYFDFVAEQLDCPVETNEQPITEDDSFPEQWAAIRWELDGTTNADAWKCSRRAGKTDGSHLLAALAGQEREGFRILYIHHTREVGKQQFFEPLRELLKRKGIPELDHDLTALNVTFGKRCFVQVVGCDKLSEVRKKLGFKWDLIIIDECQEFQDHVLVRLVDKTILPTLIDKGGKLLLMGTPADIEAGLWFEAITGKSGFRLHEWTLRNNTKVPDIVNKAIKAMGIRGFKIDWLNPSNNDVLIQREIFGLQVIDPTKLLYCYRRGPEFNDWPVAGVPDVDNPAWCYAMGIDIGGANEGNDRDALVILGWLKNDPQHRLWEREAWEATEMDSEDFCRRVLDTFNFWRQRGPVVSVCGDTGGAGANKALAWIAKRMGGLRMTPKPTSVETSTRFLNDEFRSCRLKVNPLGLIARDAKICTKVETYHSDIMAACRYAHWGVHNYLAKEDETSHDHEKTPDQLIKEARWRQRKDEKRKLQDPWNQEGGWSG